MNALLGGSIQVMFASAPTVAQQVKAGKLRALATASASRSPQLADVPTMAEAGQPRVVAYSWTNLVGPPGMPADIVKKLGQACQAILAEPEVVARLASMSNEPTPATPEQASSFVAAEVARWAEVVKVGNIRVE